MNADPNIRPATQHDLPEVNRLLVATWHDTYDDLLGKEKVNDITARWHAIELLSRQLDAAGLSFLIAEAGGTIVGHALADARGAPTLVLSRLYVLPSYQRRGIGRRLLAAATDRWPGAAKVRLIVEAQNSKAISFYEQQGFVSVGEGIEEGVLHLTMEKALR